MVDAPSNGDGDPDADLITGTGFYKALNNVPFSGWNYVIEVQYSGNADETQYAWDMDDLYYLAIRKKRSGVWSPWEYVNPPLQLGIEYCTVERYLGKPVYAKAISLGALPNNSQKLVNHGVENMDYCLSLTGTVANYNILGFNGVASVFCGITAISVETNSDQTSREGIAVIRYTKSTD